MVYRPLLPLSATHLVLSTPELLELILSHLPPLQLLLTQRVSTTFNQLITTSPHLQTLLFFRPNWTLIGHPTTSKPGPRPLNNLMLRRVLSGTYPTMTLHSHNFATLALLQAAKSHFSLPSRGSITRVPPESEPEPDSDSDYISSTSLDLGLWTWTVNIALPSSSSAIDPDNPALVYENASWRRMFLCQPPPTELHLCKRWRRQERPAVVAHDGDGVRMWDLVRSAGVGAVAQEGQEGYRQGQGQGQGQGGWHRAFI